MTRNEFAKALKRMGLSPDFCELDGRTRDGYVMEERQACWVVYFGERGIEFELRYFATESEALDDLLSRLSPVVR